MITHTPDHNLNYENNSVTPLPYSFVIIKSTIVKVSFDFPE